MIKKLFLIIGIYLFSSFNMVAQHTAAIKIIDSYRDSVFFYENKDSLEKAFYWANKVFSMSKPINYERGYFTFYYIKGKRLMLDEKIKEAKEIFLKIERYKIEAKYKSQILNCYAGLQFVYQIDGDYKKMTQYAIKQLEYAQQLKDSTVIGLAYSSIANSYSVREKYDEALIYYKKSLVYVTNIRLIKNRLSIKLEIANIYLNKNDYTNALLYTEGSAVEFLKIKDYENYYATLKHYVICYSELKKFTDAKHYLTIMQNAKLPASDFRDLYLADAEASYYYCSKNYVKAIYFNEKNLKISSKIGYKINNGLAFNKLYRCYKNTNQYEKALYYFEKANHIGDSIMSKESEEYIDDLNAKYEVQEKNNVILAQQNILKEKDLKIITATKNQQKIIFASILFFLLVSFSVIIGYNIFKNKRKWQAQKQAIFDQRNLFAAILNTQESERSRIASDLHDGVNQLLAGAKMKLSMAEGISDREKVENVINNTMQLIDNATNEIRNVAHNMMPLTLEKYGLIEAIYKLSEDLATGRHPLKLNVEVSENLPAISPTSQIHIYRIIQELVNNTLKHSGASIAEITMNLVKNNFSILYKDNGKGIKPLESKKKNYGIGMNNIEVRVNFLNGQFKINEEIQRGVEFTLIFPLTNLA